MAEPSQFYLLLRGGVIVGHAFPGADGRLEVTLEATFFVAGAEAVIKDGQVHLTVEAKPEPYFGDDKEGE